MNSIVSVVIVIYEFKCNSVVLYVVKVCKKKMLLNEMIIERGLIAKTADKEESLTKQEINSILKYGAENLFKEEDEGTGIQVVNKI